MSHNWAPGSIRVVVEMLDALAEEDMEPDGVFWGSDSVKFVWEGMKRPYPPAEEDEDDP